MNTDTLKGNWNEVKGQAKQRWAKLTDSDLTFIEGDSDKLAGLLQKHYGYAKEQARSMIDDFKESLEDEGGQGRSALNNAVNKVSNITEDVFKKTKKMAENLKDDAGEYGKAVVDFVEKKPYQSVAIAAVAGLVIGLLIKK